MGARTGDPVRDIALALADISDGDYMDGAYVGDIADALAPTITRLIAEAEERGAAKVRERVEAVLQENRRTTSGRFNAVTAKQLREAIGVKL